MTDLNPENGNPNPEDQETPEVTPPDVVDPAAETVPMVDGPDTTTADNADDVDLSDPHAADENPENHIGDEVLDPWKDATALDWPNEDAEQD